MTNDWPPPQGQPRPSAWVPPFAGPAPAAWTPPQEPVAPAAWPPPQVPVHQPGWQQPYGAASWNAEPRQRTAEDHLLEWALPVNRSGLAIAAGYVALISMPVLVAGPVGVLLGILALRDLKKNPHRRGAGRAWFAIIYGGLATGVLLVGVVMVATAGR